MTALLRTLFISFAIGISAFLVACNTIQGAGQDISATGQGLSTAAVKAKNS